MTGITPLSSDVTHVRTKEQMVQLFNYTGWWFQIFFMFTPYLGKIPILANIFQRGTPLKINMEHNHGGLVQIFFLSKKIGDL